ncbi:hypothetical protein [Calycomorphotria hydatis]|nr:hypothetical protein [Calycomorphotria hydatis]
MSINPRSVIPAQAGIPFEILAKWKWIPARVGMTIQSKQQQELTTKN